jgi:polysaccharide deacetylase family protein (PEP-CTERM system associated)
MTSTPISQPVPNFLTLDVEEWYMANYEGDDFSRYVAAPSRIEWETERLLEICALHGVKATCFIVGTLAEAKPGIVKQFHQAGHEIASHGFAHGLVYRMSPDAFRTDLRRSLRLLEELTGEKVSGFRAPSWSVSGEVLPWYYGILEEEGLSYSSSVYPGRTYLFGIPGFPEKIHRPEIGGRVTPVYEVPQALTRVLGQRIGFSGGFFLRLFPAWYIKAAMARKNRQGTPVFLYLHPREIDPRAARLPLKPVDRLVHYWNVSGADAKLCNILSDGRFRFTTIREYIASISPGT